MERFLIFAAIVTAILFIRSRYLQVKKLKWYGRRLEDLWVVEEPAGWGLELGELTQHVITARHRQVMREVSRQEELLARAGNKNKIQVHPIFYQAGSRVNETIEEYEAFVIETIKAARAEQHDSHKKRDADWYLAFHHKDRQSFEYLKAGGKNGKN